MTQEQQSIRFYRTGDPYGWMSNFYKSPIVLQSHFGKDDNDYLTYPTVEHYFQAMKFENRIWRDIIRRCESPMDAAKYGRTREYPLREDWEDYKEEVMEVALYHKFTQHPELKALLLETGDAILIEHTTNDSYWGDGGDGSGLNRLGHLLMKIRGLIREREKVQVPLPSSDSEGF